MEIKSIKDYAVEMACKGGKARADKLTAKRRKEIASAAAKARWAKKGSGTQSAPGR